LKKHEERYIQAFENKGIRKILRIPWTMLMTREQVYTMAGAESELLNHIKNRKLWYFGHVVRLPQDNIESSIMMGLTKFVRGRGRPKVCWLDNIVAWTDGVGRQLTACYLRQVALSSAAHLHSQRKQRWHCGMTWHLHLCCYSCICCCCAEWHFRFGVAQQCT